MNLALLVVFLPLLGAAITGLSVRAIPARVAEVLTSSLLIASAVLSTVVFNKVAIGGEHQVIHLLDWINSGSLNISWSIKLDTLTAVMFVVVTYVSSVVHVYSIGYMSHDEHRQRFMCYLSLFTFFMLVLVTADNFVQLFVGWEGVGLCSYLLIGFWFEKASANNASMKAFIVNRVGDFGLLLGMFAIFVVFGTLNFDEIFSQISAKQNAKIDFLGFELEAINTICVLLFIGCMGKSAQLGLHTWLPDAMEGPTPVSALIHAATMVTAGVFLIARASPLFDVASDAMILVAAIGALTAFFAASVGLVQNDIKRIIAYSTCSQLGYMFFACGVGAYSVAVFHLMTHAFFKALLFLSAGSVIHSLDGEQDIRKMGGLWKKIPVTYAFMWIGSLALAGIPVFAGYYSKDLILESAYAAHTSVGNFAFWLGILVALMTAFYSWRLIFMVFHGKFRGDKHAIEHAHESPAIMNLPLLLLVAGSLVSGAYAYHMLGFVDPDSNFWGVGDITIKSKAILENVHHVPAWVPILPTIMGIVGIFAAFVIYLKLPSFAEGVKSKFNSLYKFLLNKWYFDELYEVIFVRTSLKLSHFLWQKGDVKVIDGLGVNGSAILSLLAAKNVSKSQTGFLYHYAFTMLLGFVALLTWLLFYLDLI